MNSGTPSLIEVVKNYHGFNVLVVIGSTWGVMIGQTNDEMRPHLVNSSYINKRPFH